MSVDENSVTFLILQTSHLEVVHLPRTSYMPHGSRSFLGKELYPTY